MRDIMEKALLYTGSKAFLVGKMPKITQEMANLAENNLFLTFDLCEPSHKSF